MNRRLAVSCILTAFLFRPSGASEIYKTRSDCISLLGRQGSDKETIEMICSTITTDADKQKAEERRIQELDKTERERNIRLSEQNTESWIRPWSTMLDDPTHKCERIHAQTLAWAKKNYADKYAEITALSMTKQNNKECMQWNPQGKPPY